MRKLIIIIFIFSCYNLLAQSVIGLRPIITAMDSNRSRLPEEKLYLQTDKPYYTLGDTLWFKSYLLNADYLTPSAKSGLLYVELDNATGRMVKRIMVPVTSGISWGDIALDEKGVPEGSYTLRAYTNWMRNFGEDYVFKKNIYISALSNSTLVKASFKLDSLSGKNKVTADLTFTGLNKDPIRVKDMQLKLMNGRHNLFKDKATTDMTGNMNLNFDLADKTQLKDLSIIANQTGKGITDTATLTIPVTINRPENTDVQFMPEGGNLVAGIPAKVGFKAIGEDGKGTDINGKIINSSNQTITQIQSIHAGMGSFEFKPEINETYMAVINLPNKTTKSYPLPKIDPTGTALRITNKGDDSLEVVLGLKPGVESQKSKVSIDPRLKTQDLNTYYLIGQSRGVVCYAAAISFKETTIKKIISKDLFPTGIARFTLLNSANIPLNERIVYIDHNDNLNITVTTNKPNYTTRDSIALAIAVKDKDGNPVHGTFGLSVTDNSQVKADTTGSNIINNLLFTSDLKGTVEEPGWYFEQDNNKTIQPSNDKTTALDNLLLTQGWVGYDWKQVFDPKIIQPQYEAEPEFTIKGRITGPFNNSVGRAAAVLYLKTLFMKKDTMFKIYDMPTDKMGHFTFKSSNFTILSPRLRAALRWPHPAVIDTSFTESFKLMIVGLGKARNTGLKIENEFKPPVFTTNGIIPPWYVNSDTTLLNNNATKNEQLKAEANYRGEGHLLKEVKIKEKKIIPGSHNLNGPGEADQLLDERELQKAGKMSLGELLEKKIKGFTVYGLWSPHYYDKAIPWYYLIKDKAARIVIDGVDLEKLYDGSKNGPQGHDRYTFLKGYLDYYTAEDITGIEVMYNTMYGSKYALAYLPDPLNISHAYIEITTRSGSGPYLKANPLLYLYKPLAFSIPQKFYQPRYTLKNVNTAPGTDLRSTIHWEPNVITDKDGKATVSFFSADKPADYTVIMEGTDLNGNFGYKQQQIKVASAAALK